MKTDNADEAVVRDFGEEWSRFDQSSLSAEELQRMFQSYFAIFPWRTVRGDAIGMDVGCGSGRWARFVSARVAGLHCIDPSPRAIEVARRNLAERGNCQFHVANANDIPLPDESLDFAYSLGVLHHVPDTSAALQACVRKLKRGAPFLLYLYYRFDGRPLWFRALWRMTDVARWVIARLPFGLKVGVTNVLATLVYFPLARFARVAEKFGFDVDVLPLSQYRDKSFYTMRTDALDRFGTRLEKRFTQSEIRSMMTSVGLTGVTFSTDPPYWCAVGYRA
jgi:ubiquinone/menaquinone biosynthesis C-methylase UbiE